MKKRQLAVVVLCLVSGAVLARNAETDQRVAASRAAVKAFATQLKGQLVKAMKSGGPVKAVGVCNLKAPEIAHSVSAAKGMEIGRTSLKTRNPRNAPDPWEKKVLEQFEQRKAKGESPRKMEYFEVVDGDDGREFRYMKAIPTGPVCLTCHGEAIPQQARAKLDELYPRDQARGFRLGDIRGAFTIRQKVE